MYTVLRKKAENRQIAGTTPWYALYKDGKIPYLYLLKRDACGGIEDKKITVPVYLAGQIGFDRGRKNAE